MAQAYPNSRFIGFDYHAPSIDRAREAAAAAGVSDRTDFQVASAQDIYPGSGYDLVCHLRRPPRHGGDPAEAPRCASIRRSLAPDGTWLLVEPFAHDNLSDNLNPVGRMMYSASTMICTPASQSQEVGLALGAQAGEARLRRVVGGRASVPLPPAPPRPRSNPGPGSPTLEPCPLRFDQPEWARRASDIDDPVLSRLT